MPKCASIWTQRPVLSAGPVSSWHSTVQLCGGESQCSRRNALPGGETGADFKNPTSIRIYSGKRRLVYN